MAASEFGKREFLRAAGGGLFALFAGNRAIAQDGKVLGLDLPKQIFDLLPRKPLNYLRMAEAVVALEREADRKGLPQSSLAIGKGQSLANIADSLYLMAMPRLVALVDRSEATDPEFAEKAGELLAELHQSQRELPESLRLISPLLAPEANQPFRNLMQGEPDPPLSKARDFASLRAEYGRKFGTLKVKAEFAESANWHLEMMRKSRERYQSVADATEVPWHFIAATHALEASFNFRAHLHNGDFPLSARTRQVPAGRPLKWLPPSDWESSAKDALRLLGFTGQSDWSLERTLYRLEAYNGLGYRNLGVPTPYLWSFSNHYDRGKFVADGRFSATARSQQCGAAVMLKLLQDGGEIRLEAAI